MLQTELKNTKIDIMKRLQELNKWQEEQQTELGNNSVINNVVPRTEKQADIVKKLQQLNKWQEEQKKLLEAKQTAQRQMLGMEQQTLYQMLGIQNDGSELSEQEDMERLIKGDKLAGRDLEVEDVDEYEEEEHMEMSSYTSQVELEEDNIDHDEVERTEEPSTYKTLTSGYGTEDCLEVNTQKPKKPFLKRGQGLKQRFKIDPDELRINNLPKYKYANAHPTLRLKPPGIPNKQKEIKTKQDKLGKSLPKPIKPIISATTLDFQEQRFQNLLISSKNTCSSTPDTKSSFSSQKHITPNSNNTSTASNKQKCLQTKSQITQKLKNINECTPAQTPTMAWSKILDPQQLTPLEVPRNRLQTFPQSEESMFELLEQKALNGSFDMNSSCIKQFMERRLKEKLNDTEDNIPVQERLKTKRLEPIVQEQPPSSTSHLVNEMEPDESQLTEDEETITTEDTTHKTIETTNSSYNPRMQDVKVRFSESNETHEYEEINSTINNSTRLSAGENDQESEVDASNGEFFNQFKQALFAALQNKADLHLANDTLQESSPDTTLTPKDSLTNNNINNNNNNSIYNNYPLGDLEEKTNMIKTRLSELETEINNFKENNLRLLKAKQDHELEKSLHAQEHLEAMERLKDEKIQMEIYLHDERVKLEDEKRHFEQSMKMKSQGALAKERKDNERLREQVAKLEMELKTKDANHTSAQARLRTQIRNLERDQKKFHEQIETLKKENKRLENENLKISREQNNKLLQEINRNIAKLAPKQIQNSTASMPEEGPPTMVPNRSISKVIVATATANRQHYQSPANNYGKTQKFSSTRYSTARNSNKMPSPPSSPEADTTPESSFNEENNKNLHHKQYILDNEDDEDILKEFQNSPVRIPNGKAQKEEKSLKQIQEEPTPPPPSPRKNENNANNMKREIVNGDGSKDIWYPNGNLKKISADGMLIRMLYYNKDIKETNVNEGTVKYYYAETNTWHTTYLDGLEILEFPNGQVEHRHKDGVVEVHYPNNSVKIMNPKDEHKQEEWRFADGTHLVQMRNGDKILSLPNGQKEIHNKLHKRREYPDGTVKIAYPDGSTETRYSNGRVRLKDKDGKLVMDTDMAK